MTARRCAPGLIKKEQLPNGLPSCMQGFGYNLRRPIFQDPRVREALAYAFDFEWSNKNPFYGAYERTRSYFDNSELAATGSAAGRGIADPRQFPRARSPTPCSPPSTIRRKYDGSGNIRDGLRAALKLLHAAGWSFKDEKLVNDKTGQPFEFEILLDDPAIRADRSAVCRQSRTHGHHRTGPHGRYRAI